MLISSHAYITGAHFSGGGGAEASWPIPPPPLASTAKLAQRPGGGGGKSRAYYEYISRASRTKIPSCDYNNIYLLWYMYKQLTDTNDKQK